MPIDSTARGSIRDVGIFFVAFAAVWTADVIVAWRLEMVPEALRPWLRTGLWIGAVGAWIAWRRTPAPARWLGLAPLGLDQAALAVVTFASIFGGNLLRVWFLAPPLHELAAAPLPIIAWSFAAVFVEELVFRGVVQTRLAEGCAALPAILAAAALFLLIHVPGWVILAMPIDARSAVSIFLIGVICGGLRHWSGSLWPAVAAHWANNLGAML